MTVTIRDVAKRLNLSITTVSRALDGYADVAEDTRQRVIQAANEMGYVPTGAARQLRRQRTDTIGYILPTQKPRFTDPFFSEFIAGLGDGAASANFDLLVSTAPPEAEIEQTVYQRWVHSRRVDGMVLSYIRLNDWRTGYMTAENFPFVATGHNTMQLDYPYIEIDGRAGMAALIKHLIELGHHAIAFVGGPPDLTLQVERFAGYQEGLARGGIPFNPSLIIEGDLTRTAGYQALQKLLELPAPPTAIACVNDLTAFGVIRAAHERSIRVGHDLAVTGFDGIADAEVIQPPLTTLNQPVYDIARRLVNMLIQLIEGELPENRQVVLQPEIVPRESSTGQVF